MILLIFTRILDVITTLLNVQKYGGWDVELNPTMRYFGTRGLFIPYQIIALTIVILIVERTKHKDFYYCFLSILSITVVAINIYCLFL